MAEAGDGSQVASSESWEGELAAYHRQKDVEMPVFTGPMEGLAMCPEQHKA